MKRITILSLLLVLFISTSAQALSWAYPFVVWNGNVYEVRGEETIEESKVGKVIGKVKTKPNDMTGDYYGNASNYYPKGTEYYAINGEPTSGAIAVKHDGQWVKAVYVHSAPFHIMNVVTDLVVLSVVAIIALIIVGFKVNLKKPKVSS